MSQETSNLINQQVANWGLLNIKFHNYHWFVRGETFFELHEKFEELYNDAHNTLDEVAERLMMVGGKPVASLTDILSSTTLKEAAGNETPQQMVQQVITDFTQLSTETKAIIAHFDQAKDIATVDLFTGILRKLEKHIWLFQSYAG